MPIVRYFVDINGTPGSAQNICIYYFQVIKNNVLFLLSEGSIMIAPYYALLINITICFSFCITIFSFFYMSWGEVVHSPREDPNDTAYKRWSCHSGLKLLYKLCRTSPPPAMGSRFTVFGHAGHADPLDGWPCCSQKRVMSRPIQVRQL